MKDLFSFSSRFFYGHWAVAVVSVNGLLSFSFRFDQCCGDYTIIWQQLQCESEEKSAHQNERDKEKINEITNYLLSLWIDVEYSDAIYLCTQWIIIHKYRLYGLPKHWQCNQKSYHVWVFAIAYFVYLFSKWLYISTALVRSFDNRARNSCQIDTSCS